MCLLIYLKIYGVKAKRTIPYNIVDNVIGAPNIIAPALGKENVTSKISIQVNANCSQIH